MSLSAPRAMKNLRCYTGLVGYWTFDGGSIDWHTNTVADMSGNAANASIVGLSTTTLPAGGKIGQGFNFPGTASTYLSAGSSIPLDSNNWTLHVWYKPSSTWAGGQRCQRLLSFYGDGPTLWACGSRDWNSVPVLVEGKNGGFATSEELLCHV
jgi:hypothetical protein